MNREYGGLGPTLPDAPERRRIVDPIYGFRYVTVEQCLAHHELAFVGNRHVAQHGVLSPEATCLADATVAEARTGLSLTCANLPPDCRCIHCRARNNNTIALAHAAFLARRATEHPTPVAECHCGLYAARDPDFDDATLYSAGTPALLLVQLIGKTQQHPHGWRTSRLRIRALFALIPDDDDPDCHLRGGLPETAAYWRQAARRMRALAREQDIPFVAFGNRLRAEAALAPYRPDVAPNRLYAALYAGTRGLLPPDLTPLQREARR